MGQRHQMFLIARLFPKKPAKSTDQSSDRAFYRCIGAYHLQWCYGILALMKTARFISLVKNEYNAEIIKDEIRRAQYQYGRPGQEPKLPRLPCPYSILLLGSAVDNVILGDVDKSHIGYSFGNSVLPAGMRSWGGDNNDGITIIDVTDPMNPAIGFLLDPSRILTPKQYASSYEEDFDDQDVKAAIDSLDGVKLVTRDMLAEAWPSEYKPARKAQAEALDLSSIAQEVPRLSDFMLGPAIEISSQSGDTSQLESLIWMPGKAELIKKALCAGRPFPAESLDLLIKILQHEAGTKSFAQLDLSGLHLSSSQITNIVSNSDIVKGRPLAVNLSGNSILDTAAVSAVLTAFPKLRRLTLLDTGLTDDQLLQLLSNSPQQFYGLSDLIHPALLLAPPDPKREYYMHSNTLTLLTRNQSHTVSASSIPFFNVEKALKCIIQCIFLANTHNSTFSLQTTWIPALALSAGVPVSREDGAQYPLADEHWNQRTVACVPHMRSRGLLDGEGWFFIADWTSSLMVRSGPSKRYGFIKANSEAVARAKAQAEASRDSATATDAANDSTSDQEGNQKKSESAPPNPPDLWHIYDARGFASEMQKEGRALPDNTEELLAKFEQLLMVKSGFGPDETWALVTSESLRKILPPAYLLGIQPAW